MSGNVYEWTNSGTARGGCWNLNDYGCAVDFKGIKIPLSKLRYNVGFRLTRSKKD